MFESWFPWAILQTSCQDSEGPCLGMAWFWCLRRIEAIERARYTLTRWIFQPQTGQFKWHNLKKKKMLFFFNGVSAVLIAWVSFLDRVLWLSVAGGCCGEVGRLEWRWWNSSRVSVLGWPIRSGCQLHLLNIFVGGMGLLVVEVKFFGVGGYAGPSSYLRGQSSSG